MHAGMHMYMYNVAQLTLYTHDDGIGVLHVVPAGRAERRNQ